MKGKSVFASLAELLERNKKLKIATYATIVVLALVIFLTSGIMGSGGKTDKPAESNAQNNELAVFDETALEQKLEQILSHMEGVGNVFVMVTLDKKTERIVATEEEQSSNEGGMSSGSRPATVSGSGGENPIILTEVYPQIRGVIVIAEGASNIYVKMNLITAVSTVLGIGQDRVQVFEMNGD